MSVGVASASMQNGLSRKDKLVATTLNYYLDPPAGDTYASTLGTAGYFRRKYNTQPAEVLDVRGHEGDYNLDTHGFQFARHNTAQQDFTNDTDVRNTYYPELAQLMKEVTGASHVFVYSHIVRQDNPAMVQASLASDPKLAKDDAIVNASTGAHYIHIDQSPAGAIQILQDNLPDDSSLLHEALHGGKRWGIINIWRPISRIRQNPLAVCDARSVADESLVPTKLTFPPKSTKTQLADASKGDGIEIYYLRWSEGQRWHFKSGMERDEVLFIKCFDSIDESKGIARRCPHSAFPWNDGGEGAKESLRESIETRCLVFWDEQP